jgi:hypothetical protein
MALLDGKRLCFDQRVAIMPGDRSPTMCNRGRTVVAAQSLGGAGAALDPTTLAQPTYFVPMSSCIKASSVEIKRALKARK